MGKFLSDLFSMRFDIIIPLSSCIVALMLAAVLFCIRYFSYLKNKRKYEKKMRMREKEDSVIVAGHVDHTSSGTLSG